MLPIFTQAGCWGGPGRLLGQTPDPVGAVTVQSRTKPQRRMAPCGAIRVAPYSTRRWQPTLRDCPVVIPSSRHIIVITAAGVVCRQEVSERH